MTRDNIIRMAREAGGADITSHGWTSWVGTHSTEFLERFAALVAAEKDKEIVRLREENVYLKEVYENLVEDRKELFDDLDKAVAAEREACAKACEETRFPDSYTAIRCAAAIRARGEV